MPGDAKRMPAVDGLVVYATKYGSTREYARNLADQLGVDSVPAAEVTAGMLLPCGLVVLGSPIYGFSVLPEMEGFLERLGGSLAGKLLAAFAVCGDTVWIPRAREGGDRNLAKLTRLLPHPPAAAAVFGGRMCLDQLDTEDHRRIMMFFQTLGREPAGFDRMDPGMIPPFTARIRAAAHGG